jgi:hypothetical protein
MPKHVWVNLEYINKSTSYLTHLLVVLQPSDDFVRGYGYLIDTALPPILGLWAVNIAILGRSSSSTFTASALEVSGLLAPPPGRFTPGKGLVPIVQEFGWALVLVWTGTANFFFCGVGSPALPARIESLYRLRCVYR